jgi:hypothetical protein
VELKTAVTSVKKRTDLQDPQEEPRAGIHQVSKQDFQLVLENKEMDLVERLAPSKMKKEIVHGVGAGNVEAPATRDSFAPPKEKKKWIKVRT